MNCSIQRYARTACNDKELKLFVADLPEEVKTLLNTRCNAEIRSPSPFKSLPLQTVCKWHEEEFLSKYEEFQRDINGCCSPFNNAIIHSCYTDLHSITLEEELRYKSTNPYIIHGRQLCQQCLKTLHNTETPEYCNVIPQFLKGIKFSEVFIEKEVQDMYMECLVKHGRILEPCLKHLQAKAVHSIMLQKDVLCVLATNYGKTLIQIVPSFLVWKNNSRTSVTLIISPLSALMEDFERKIIDWGLKCFKLIGNEENYKLIKGAIDDITCKSAIYILASPEVLQTPYSRRLLGSVVIDYIMVDECHTAVTWAEDFRRDFSKLHEIRQATMAPVALFTATITNDMLKKLIINTGVLMDNFATISDSPDRPEIFLQLEQKRGMEQDLRILINDYMKRGSTMDKTLFFIDSVSKTHEYNIAFKDKIPNKGKEDGYYISDHFSSATEPEARLRILKDFADENGKLKVLFSTVSYGMGIDNKTIRRVVINDIGKDSNDVWQKVGRACRDGQEGTAVLLCRGISHRDIIIRDVCIRHSILRKLMGYEKTALAVQCVCLSADCTCYLCVCCSVCKKTCKCREKSKEAESITSFDESSEFSEDSLDRDDDFDKLSDNRSTSEITSD